MSRRAVDMRLEAMAHPDSAASHEPFGCRLDQISGGGDGGDETGGAQRSQGGQIEVNRGLKPTQTRYGCGNVQKGG